MTIHNKSSIALAIGLAVIAGCSSAPHRPDNLAIAPIMREEAPQMREAPTAGYEAEYVQPQYYLGQEPVVEAAPPDDPAVPTSADDLYQRAKDIMQATNDPDAQKVAVDLLTQAADMGHAESMRVLGVLAFRDGPGRQDEAVGLLERAAKTNVKAMRQLGILYGNLGATHLDDTDKAIQYFQSASALGDGESSLYLSKVMARLGLNDDAIRWKDVAREQGVGEPSLTPQKVAESRSSNVQRSFELQRAAMSGDPVSMYEFALMLLDKSAQGSLMGYEHSAEFEAYYWLRRGAQLGNSQAAAKLSELAYVEDLMRVSKVSFEKLNHALSGARG